MTLHSCRYKKTASTLAQTLRCAICVCLIAAPGIPLAADNLYSWTGANGTPTYSPDPPPAGTVYTIVGPDLEPLSRYQNSASGAAANRAARPTQAAPVPNWKPVVLTSPPAGGAAQPIIKSSTRKPAASAPVAPAPASTQRARTTQSSACRQLRRQISLLESKFASATSNAEMDQTILALRKESDTYRTQCG